MNSEKTKKRQRNYYREIWYPKNNVTERSRAALRKDKLREYIISLKGGPCTDCGKKYPHYVMDFDHVRGIKVIPVSKMITNGSIARITEEVKKCELVCSNCHRVRTWKRWREKLGKV